MSLAIATSELDVGSRVRGGVPLVPSWTLPRARLDQLLEKGAGGMVTVVSGPTGAGKTLGVASWAAGPTSPADLVWLNLARGGADPDRVWRLLGRRLQEAGEQLLPQVPSSTAAASARTHALVDLGETLRDRGPWTVVLDGYPTGPSGRLGSELEIVLDHAGRAVRLVVLCQSEPALDVHRYLAAGELLRVRDADLVMDPREIRAVLRLAGCAADRATVAAVADRTAGWACGVRQAVVALETTRDLSEAISETDRAIEDYLSNEVLARVPAPVRRLLVGTSVVDVVPPGLVRTVLGTRSRCAVDEMVAATGLVQRLPDGSFRCHPLLRSAARRELSAAPAGTAQAVHQPVVRWFAEHGQPEAAVELCLATGDHAGAASILVTAHAVPMIVAGTAPEGVTRSAALPEVQAVEPLLRTAVALARTELLAAEVTLGSRASTPGAEAPASQIAAGFLALGIARLSGRPVEETGLIRRTRELVARSSVTDPGLDELTVVLDAFAGAAETSTGDLEQAVITLTRGAERPPIRGSAAASSDCAGQLALIDAYRGDLRAATARACAVLAAASGAEWPGVAHAEVAMAWVHADRGEPAEARERLGRVVNSLPGARDRWLLLARRLVEARVLIASGRADEAMRMSASLERTLEVDGCSEWFSGLAASLTAEAMLAAGELKQALAVVTSGLGAGSVARAVLTAEARHGIGDARGAAAAIASAADDLSGAPRALQLKGWVLDARIAHEQNQLDRTLLLVERALRAASAEELRRPLAGDGAWLRWFLDRDGAALREHRPFVLSLVERDRAATRTAHSSLVTSDLVLEQLTERETQVLGLLALMCSTEEIAAELFVSSNTVKTHLKGIFRKYAVNRRVDAVRRGRELGAC